VPVYLLDESSRFPPATHAESDGLLAVGGDLRPERLLCAYREGIFPWYATGQPILWFSPDPRTVIDTRHVRVSRGMRRSLAAAAALTVTADNAFGRVIHACATVARKGQGGTWITSDMVSAYERLHELGFAHSCEAWLGERLVGGVYGVSIGRYFAGESMFHTVSGASTKALLALLAQLCRWDITLFDCQMRTPHVGRLGAQSMRRADFLERLRSAIRQPTRRGRWRLEDIHLL
jgi:leucyl/phenylalanyl-tRNA--protein transferase